MRATWTTEQAIVAGFALAFLVLSLVAGVSIRTTWKLQADLETVSEINKIDVRIGKLASNASQMVPAARRFIEDGGAATFAEFQAIVTNIRADERELFRIFANDPDQTEKLAFIVQNFDNRIDHTTLGGDQAQMRGLWEPPSLTRNTSLMRTFETIRAMDAQEVSYLEKRNNDARKGGREALLMIGTVSILALVMVCIIATWILRDLKARRRAAEELELARQAAEAASIAKSAFLANMSHEVRTPLTSILGYVDLMLEPEEFAQSRPEFLQTIRRSGEHLLTLINDILDVSKIEAGRMTVESVECRLADVLADVDSLMRTRATEKGIDFSIRCATPMPDRAATDPTRFRQILVNLVGNAIKFTDEGDVRVQVACAPATRNGTPIHEITVDVTDTGVGISRKQQETLFQPFMQADLSTTRRFGGSGLGLSISRRLARMMGGELTLTSELDKGSQFRLTLPMELLPGAAMLPPGDMRIAMAGSMRTLEPEPRELKLRILLAEDGVENRDVITLHLRHAGCEVFQAEDGEQAYIMALQAWRSSDPYDVILMDMQMPVMDGYTATSKLRGDGYTGVIIALTAHAMKEDRDRCLRVGCDEYATKPVQVPRLLQLMARFSGRMGAPTVTEKMLENPVLRQLTVKFLDGLPQTLDTLRQLAGKDAWDDLALTAHRLAGAGGAYGFEEITRTAKHLEKAARVASKAEYDAAFPALEQAVDTARGRVKV